MKRITIKILFFIFILNVFACNYSNLVAQLTKIHNSEEANDFSVVWTKKISSTEDLKMDNSILITIKDFIFGKSNIALEKPVNLVCLDSNLIIVLDQGIQYPVIINQAKNKFFINHEKLSYPSLLGICRWEDNKVLFTDSKLNKIFYLNSVEETPKSFNDKISIEQPTGIGYNSLTKEIWVAETGKHQIKIIDNIGNIKKIIGHRGNNKCEFNYPTYLCIDQKGFVYIVDALNFRIQIFDKNGDFISMFGESGDSPGYFSSIKGIASDSYGHIYIVDALFNAIQVFDHEGNFLYNFGGLGKNDGEFYLPTGIFIDANNTILVADTYNSRIQFFRLIRGNNK